VVPRGAHKGRDTLATPTLLARGRVPAHLAGMSTVLPVELPPSVRRHLSAAVLAPALVAALCAPGASQAQATAAEPVPDALVTAEWLAAHLDDPDLVLLHVEGRAERYDEAHIPGARRLDPAALVWEGDPPVGSEIRSPAEIEAALEAVGVGDRGRIVMYGSSALTAARAWMTLDAMGLGGRTSLLDGGLGGWQRDGRPTSDEAPSFEPGELTLHPRDDVIVGAAWVLEHLDDPATTLVDARSEDEYAGAVDGAGEGVHAGHIPGAYSLPWERLVESRDVPLLKDRDEIRRLFEASGAADGSTVVAYCATGVRGSYDYFVARLLGYDAKLYDGSWREWSSRDLPFVSGSARR